MSFFIICFMIIIFIAVVYFSIKIFNNYIKRKKEFYKSISTYIVFEVDKETENIDLWLMDISNYIDTRLIDLKNKKIVVFDNQKNNNITQILCMFCSNKNIIYTNDLCILK